MKIRTSSIPLRVSSRALAQTVAALALFSGGMSHAATFTVTNCADTGAGSLRQAVEGANTNPGADVINFSLTCSAITLASTITIGDTVNITGPGANALTIASPTARAMNLVPVATAPAFQEVNISGLRFAQSTATTGGAISAIRTNLAITTSIFDGNDATTSGGAIYFESPNGETRTLDISYTTFLNNGVSAGSGGGAIYQDGSALITIRRSLFRGNGAAGVQSGGAIRSIDTSALLVVESGFYANAANYGGAISNSGTGTSRVVGSSFVSNTAGGLALEPDFGGGAIDISLGAMSIENSTFAANSINGLGVGSAIAARGAGITMLNTTVAKNEVRSAATTNAAIAVFSAPGSDNSVARLTLRNTVSTTNIATDVEKRHDVWVDGRGINIFFTSSTSLVSVLRNAAVVTQSPGGALLANAENNGGIRVGEQTAFSEPLLTMLIGSGSALINAGNNTDATVLTTDQRGAGFPRVIDSVVDIGAIEYQVQPQAITPASVPTLGQSVLILLAMLLAAACAPALWGSTKNGD